MQSKNVLTTCAMKGALKVKIHYLAYGSNLHPMRLVKRVPSAQPLARIEMPDQKLTFHKSSKDGSGKCNIWECAGSVAYGVMYEMEHSDLTKLNSIEGLGCGYRLCQTKVIINSTVYLPHIYIAESSHIDVQISPYHWYKDFVLAGAKHHEFPSSYIDEVELIYSKSDPDLKRDSDNREILTHLNRATTPTPLPWVTYENGLCEVTPS